jgi:glycosyltransferase involved in cell wall biosynthesis
MSGIRGVPANFGGSETAVEEIGSRMAEHGDEVVVYCRKHKSDGAPEYFEGMRRVELPSINTFNLDTITHSFLSALHLLVRNTADVIHFHGMGNSLLLPLFWLSKKRTVITIDGPAWERPKWGRIARFALKLSARMAVRWGDHVIIDNHPSIAHFEKEFGFSGTYVPYGADRNPPTATDYIEELGLKKRGYVVFVGALVPDKGPDILVDAYRDVETDMPLIVVGDSPFAPDYRKALHEAAARDDRVRMLGYVYGDKYRQLVANAHTYVHPLRSDGTSPALLQAMGYGSCIVISSNPEALSAVGDGALPFEYGSSADLARKLQRVIDEPELGEDLRRRASARAAAEYNWDTVTQDHRDIYESVLR